MRGMDDYRARKAERVARHKALHGLKMETCTACSGSGVYDIHGSPTCGCCNGTGKTRQRRAAPNLPGAQHDHTPG